MTTDTPARPPKYLLVERAIGRNLADYIASQRATGLHWQQIANDLSALAGVDLSRESVRQWCPPAHVEG